MAFFGMEGSQVESVPEQSAGSEEDCLLCELNHDAQTHCLFRQLRAEDVVFIKEFTPQTGLVVRAAGVVKPGSFVAGSKGGCVHVKWAWRGERHTVVPEDTDAARGAPFYAEFDLAVQREIIELLPDSGHDPYRMVMELPSLQNPGDQSSRGEAGQLAEAGCQSL